MKKMGCTLKNYIKEHNSFPSDEDCEDFMSHCNNTGMAKRFKTFHKKAEKPQSQAFSPFQNSLKETTSLNFKVPRTTSDVEASL